ncbi:cation transporting ATPase C-terminal domain-containing protein [Mycobacterium servetii]|uniref:Cation transporting ATPase C-terminal domain-containing protein n=1 Tax=Mycobacterium servetii TaxID=3237418 RepID=A0ABV4C5L6_9MYCO
MFVQLRGLLRVAGDLPLFNTAFTTTPLSPGRWLVCLAVSSSVLWVSEARKFVLRRLDRRRATRSGPSAG